MRYHLFSFIIVVLTGVAPFVSAEEGKEDPDFPTPAILKDNVAFWKKIYTEVSMQEGLIHDRDYPLVIFKKVTGSSRSKSVKAYRKKVTNALKRINSSPSSSWSAFDRSIVNLYLLHADSSALTGAADRVRFQLGQKERFIEGLKRSGKYLDTIRTILRSHKVPLRLAYLPHVESSFNTEAYSKVGAAGLWQFMRGTGKLYGMKISYTIDERRDPVIATDAAARYLSSSYKQLGTWPLAITSYNHGVYGMKRAVRQTGSKDLAVVIQKYKSRSFRFASSNFYSCFLAASSIADNYRNYFPNVTLYAPVKYQDFVLNHYVNADNLCHFLSITKKDLIHLNPAIRPAVFAKHQQLPKGYHLHVPADKSPKLLAAAYGNIPDSLKLSDPPRPQYYRVRRGDNLYAIARRLGVPIKELALENNISRINRIYAGQVLRVPPKPVTTTIAMAQRANEKQVKVAPEKSIATASGSGLSPSEPEETADTTITDAVIEIARAEQEAVLAPEEVAINVPSKKVVKRQNKQTVHPEKSITKKKKNRPTPPLETQLSDSLEEIAFTPALVEPVEKSLKKPRITQNFDVSIYDLDAVLSSAGNSAEIIVSVDETIGHYADWLGIPTWRIRRRNDMGRRSSIRINQRLDIPIDRPDALEQFASARLEYHMAIEEDFYSQFTVTDAVSHKLKRGEALWDICNNTDNPIPLWLLRKYNRHIDLNRLQAGVELWIPQIREKTDKEIQAYLSATGLNGSQPICQPHLPNLDTLKLVP